MVGSSKSMSHSSKISTFRPSRRFFREAVLLRWSYNLPGVALRILTPRRSIAFSVSLAAAPVRVPWTSRVEASNFYIVYSVYCAKSFVGEIMSILKSPLKSSSWKPNNQFNTGSKKESVFPVPVAALIKTLLPALTYGKASFWTLVRPVMFICPSLNCKCWWSPKLLSAAPSNLFIVVFF